MSVPENIREDFVVVRHSLAKGLLSNLQYAGVDNAIIRIEAYLSDLEEVLEDKHRLTKELDVALNGDGAAAAPSLCDIVAQVQSLGPHYKANAEWKVVADKLAKSLQEHVVEDCKCSKCAYGNAALAEYKRMAK